MITSRRLACVRVRVNGLHYWPTPPETTGYLAHPHHHVFEIVVRVIQPDGDRAVEFHALRVWVLASLSKLYNGLAQNLSLFDFGEHSCETIGERVAAYLDAMYDLRVASVEIWEDDGHGAVVEFA